jgi:D-aspartate ligase
LITIAVVGADGAGKTTVAQRAVDESAVPAAYLYMGFNPESHRFALPTSHLALWLKKRVLRKRFERNAGDTERDEEFSDWGHVSISDNPIIQVLRLLNRLFESTVRIVIAFLIAAKGRVVVADRHFFIDFGLDRLLGRAERSLSTRVFSWVVVTFFPRPDLVIYLDAPAETLYARKSEATPTYLENRQSKYRAASSLLPAFEVVDASRPLSDVVADVVRLIEDFVRESKTPKSAQKLDSHLPPPPAVIVGLDSLQGLQLSRILYDRDIPTIGVAKQPDYHTCRTRTCQEIIYCDTSSEELVETLLTLGRSLETKAVLYPCQDTNVLILSRFRDALSPYFHLVLPEHHIIESLVDKARFLEIAKQFDLDVPRTYVITKAEELEGVIAEASFPLLLKPPNRDFGWNRLTKEKAVWVSSGHDLKRLYEYFQPVTPTLLAQQWIEGPDSDLYTCNVYFSQRGEQLASFVSRKIRQYPPQIGQGCLAQGISDPQVADLAGRFFKHVGLRGFGYLEFKRESGTGRLVAIEPNVGRPTGRSTLAEASGVELHTALYRDALGIPTPPMTGQSDGVKWMHLLRDVQSALHYLRRRELSLRDWFRSVRGRKVHAILSIRDPMPFVYSVGRAFGVALKERTRRVPLEVRRNDGGHRD